VISLDEPAGPPESTVRHLLAHASGLGFDEGAAISKPERRRVYSNAGFDLLGTLVSERTGMPFSRYVTEAVFEPLEMHASSIDGTPAAGGVGPLTDLLRFARELLLPTLVTPATMALATEVAFPGLDGVLPGYGRRTPNDWGLGFELRDAKDPHWTGRHNSPSTFGHFGRSGSFLWIDPTLGLGCVALADTAFGPWAIEAWPVFSDAVIAQYGPTHVTPSASD
jgi:CubicO group peptidase (beta-lactamase class C family)